MSIPTYPFQRERHWFKSGDGVRGGDEGGIFVRAADTGVHPLLGTRLRSPAIPGVAFQVELDSDDPRFLGSHRIGGQSVMPVSCFLEMLRAAARIGLGWKQPSLSEVSLSEPLILRDGAARIVQIILSGSSEG